MKFLKAVKQLSAANDQDPIEVQSTETRAETSRATQDLDEACTRETSAKETPDKNPRYVMRTIICITY